MSKSVWAFMSDYGADESGRLGELYATEAQALDQFGERDTMQATVVELVPYSELAAARAEVERLTKERDERASASVDRVALMVKLDHAVRNKERCAQGDASLNNFAVAYHYQHAIEAVALQMQQDAADLAAARAEVERLQQERDNARLAVQYESDVAPQALADLSAVRKVEEWVKAKGTRHISFDGDEFDAVGWNHECSRMATSASGDTLSALGRALAAQEAKG